jgi:peptide deformylase
MVLPVYIYGQPVLRKVAEKINPDYPELKELIDNMFETMYKADGIGLAAPQVGLSIRLLVIDASAAADEDNPDLQDFKKAFINPEILELSGDEWAYNEGCLSLPDIREDVMRPAIVKVRYYDENFQMHEDVYDGLKARIFQHEYDHIEGKLFIDRINPIRRRMISGKLRAMTKGKVNPKYKIK